MSVQVENGLSERELEILRLVATGASNKEIAHRLTISPNTVKVHLRNIFGKIGALSRTEAALYAVRAGLVANASPVSPDLASTDTSLPISQVLSDSLPEDRGITGQMPRPRRWTVIIVLLLLVLATTAISVALMMNRNAPEKTAAAISLTPTGDTRWQVLEPLPSARSNLAAVVIDNHLYAIGGETESGATGQVDMYDPSTNAWEPRQSAPISVADIQAVVIGERIFVPGGRLPDGSITDRLEIYDPQLDRWQAGAPIPGPRSAYALAALEGHLFLFGGWDGRAYVNTVYEYDPGLDAWTERSPMPTRRGWSGAAVAGGKIYVIGGYDGKHALPVNEVYNPAREASGESPWSTTEPLPGGRYALGVVGISDVLIVMGGVSPAGDELPPLRYFPSLNRWQVFEQPYPAGLSYAGVAPLEVYIYTVGGKLKEKRVAQLQAYQAVFTVIFPIVR